MFWILLVNWNVGDTGLGISGVVHFALSLPVSGTFLPSHPVIHLPDGEHIENIQTMRARVCPGNFRSTATSRRAHAVESGSLSVLISRPLGIVKKFKNQNLAGG